MMAAWTNHSTAQEITPFPVKSSNEATANLDFREVIRSAKARVFPAVVYIKSVIENLEQGEKKSQEISGSGVVISPTGEVLTNWHVIDKATSVRCLLSDGRAFDAEVVGSDKTIDFALLQLKMKEGEDPLPYAEFGASAKLEEGDFVMAMGAPWGLNRSVSIGIVSCTRRFLEDASEYSLWIQTDAAINPGNSGGPLVNTDGRVVGINTLGLSAGDNVGFSIPSETIQPLLPQLRRHGQIRWAWTGLQVQPLRDFNRDMYFEGSEGVIVAATDPGSPAAVAGLKTRDRILRVNGESLSALTGEDIPDVRRFLALLPQDKVSQFEIERDAQSLTVEITPREKGKVEGAELDCPRWDLTVKAINQFDNPDLFYFREKGVFIFGIKIPGNARASHLRERDIITEIDRQPIERIDDVKRIYERSMAEIDTKRRLVFTVLRSGLTQQVVVDIARDYSRE